MVALDGTTCSRWETAREDEHLEAAARTCAAGLADGVRCGVADTVLPPCTGTPAYLYHIRVSTRGAPYEAIIYFCWYQKYYDHYYTDRWNLLLKKKAIRIKVLYSDCGVAMTIV